MPVFNHGGVREEARLAVSRMINRHVPQGNRIYLGLPNINWADFHTVKENCRAIEYGIGVERRKSIFNRARSNCPYWCKLFNADLVDLLDYPEALRVGAGWIDLMGNLGSDTYSKIFEKLPNSLDPKYRKIPMAFSWYVARETNTKGMEDVTGIQWRFSSAEQRSLARDLYAVERLQSKNWKYEPTDLMPLRDNSHMRLMLGVFHRT
jgi:hypothetical protein